MHTSRLPNAPGTSVVPGTSSIKTPHSSRRSAARVAAAAAAAAASSNPVGVHALVFAGDWTEAGARAAAAGAAAAAYDLVEIAAFNARHLDADMTRRVFAEHGVQAACSLGLTLDADISSDSEEVSSKLLHLRWPGLLRWLSGRWVCCCYRCVMPPHSQVVARGAADLDAALTFAAAIGAQHLAGILYSALAKYPGPSTAQGRANSAREVRKLAAKAADQGIKVCLEVVNRWACLID